MMLSQVSIGQTLTVNNNSLDEWTVNYYGKSITVASGITGATISLQGANCNSNPAVTITGSGGCTALSISLGNNNTGCASGTSQCKWELTGSGSGVPCNGTTFMNATIGFV